MLLDTTILVYAVGEEHPLREPCRLLVDALGTGRVRATTTAEVIQEFAHVRARRRSRSDAAALARAFATLLAPLVVVGERELETGLRLFEDNERLGAFDAVLVAVALEHDLGPLVSVDRAFATIPQLRHVDPARGDLDVLLRNG